MPNSNTMQCSYFHLSIVVVVEEKSMLSNHSISVSVTDLHIRKQGSELSSAQRHLASECKTGLQLAGMSNYTTELYCTLKDLDSL